MATSFIFNNQRISIPGAYSVIQSGIQNPALALEFGNTLVIDTGSGTPYGGGSGINGESIQDPSEAFYTFDNIADFRNFVGGGPWWLLSEPMFNARSANNGISSLTYVRASTTTKSNASYTFTGGGSNGGTISINTKTEGLSSVGVRGDETRAVATFTPTAIGDENDTHTLQVTAGGAITLATYTVTDTPPASLEALAIELVSLVNSSQSLYGYRATRNGSVITITAPVNSGVAANSYTTTYAVTGSATGTTSGSFAGGVDGSRLTRGFSARMIAGVRDNTKYIMQFYRGSYRGNSGSIGGSPSLDIDNVSESNSTPTLLVQSVEFSTVGEFLIWAQDDQTFNAWFTLDPSSSAAGNGSIDAADLLSNTGDNLFTGGTETFSSTDIDAVLDNIGSSIYDFILADNWGQNARSANNLKILAYIESEAKVKPDLYVGGGSNMTDFSATGGSLETSSAFNSQYVTLVHGGVKVTNQNSGTGFVDYPSIYHAASALGREAGLEPQIPLTFKNLPIDGLVDRLSADVRAEEGLDAGILMTRPDGVDFTIVKGINTEQDNDRLVNQDGTTSSKQIRRIARQLNKEIIVNAREDLLKTPFGTNRNTLSREDVIAWLEGYLTSRTATDTTDNLISSYRNITVTVDQDAYMINYAFVPNFEVNFLFFTGFILEA